MTVSGYTRKRNGKMQKVKPHARKKPVKIRPRVKGGRPGSYYQKVRKSGKPRLTT